MNRLRRPRLSILLLLAAALVIRAAVPAGWMPVTDHGGIRIALCSGYGPATTLLDAGGHAGKDQPQHQGRHDPCPFGVAAGMAFDMPPPIALALPAAVPAALSGPALAAARLVAWRSLRPPARGPPTPA